MLHSPHPLSMQLSAAHVVFHEQAPWVSRAAMCILLAQVKSLRFTVEQRLELSLPYDGQTRRVKQKAVIASSIRELSSSSPSEFKKRYFITMPTLCTTISSPIISTKYTVRIQMTSARTAMLTLEVPVTMYSKGSFINGCDVCCSVINQ